MYESIEILLNWLKISYNYIFNIVQYNLSLDENYWHLKFFFLQCYTEALPLFEPFLSSWTQKKCIDCQDYFNTLQSMYL